MKDYLFATTVRASSELEAELISLGLYDYEYKSWDGGPLGEFHKIQIKVYIDDPRLPSVQALITKHRLSSGYSTEFTKIDLKNAEWFEMHATSSLDYPKPENSWKEVTYDLNNSGHCKKCGIGNFQIAPFRLGSSQPKGKRTSFFAPGWVYDEVFVRTEIQNTLLSEGLTGAHYLPPINAKSGFAFDNLVQIIVEAQLPDALINSVDFNPIQCEVCGQFKHEPSYRVKKFARLAFTGQPDIIKSAEWFGAGYEARKLILVSRRFADLIFANKWRGVKLQPVVLVNANYTPTNV